MVELIRMSKSTLWMLFVIALTCFSCNTGLGADATYVQLTTTAGDIVIELDAENAPISVDNFLGYVKKGHYDGTVFHRVVKGFMIQGGGYDSKDLRNEKETGKGIKNEGGNGLSNLKYTVPWLEPKIPIAQPLSSSSIPRTKTHPS